jgi:hypothetical protein
MPVHDPRNPMSQCPICGRAGLVGSEREVVGDKAVTVFKYHNCNHTWRVPDHGSEVPGSPRKRP